MYFKEAVERINGINLKAVGTNTEDLSDLGYEFLRRLAKFYKDEGIKQRTPMFSNIAELLGDDEEVLLSNYCNSETIEFCNKYVYIKYLFMHYIQIAKYTDINPTAIKYLNVYEPLIMILEKGGMFILKHNSLEIENSGLFPLNGWYEDFVDLKPINSEI